MEATLYRELMHAAELEATRRYKGKRAPEPGDPHVGLYPEYVEGLESTAFLEGAAYALTRTLDTDEIEDYEWRGMRPTATLQCQAQGCHELRIIPLDKPIDGDNDFRQLVDEYGWQIGDKGVQYGKTYCPRHRREVNL